MQNLIEVRDLRKHFGTLLAVDGVSLDVRRGEVLGFLGPNGAGKSTTMKMITGFLAPSAGRVSICGHDVESDPIAAKSRIGYLPEGAPAYGEMTPARFLDFVAEVRGLDASRKEARIREVVAKIHLESVLHQTIDTLSKGFKRRVGLAQAILHDPEVLILDEPTDGLDPNQKHDVRAIIKEMAPQKAIIISTHILEEVNAVCTRAAIIAKGKLLFVGTPVELEARSRYHNAVTLTVVTAAAGEVRAALAGIPGVSEVESTAGTATTTRLTAVPTPGTRIAETIQERIRGGAWQVDELFIEAGHLDEVFRSITTGAMGATRT
ncbi:MAG: ABC transporter ATP-binding protein [Gammaproteobacteria bacterium]|nr:ABC transporter ATP-binding protein [Gammaproteobacteria bacterium]MBI5618990.1 ABC transporter ATP-binding protein [Gammaproteobacteria bacterium]